MELALRFDYSSLDVETRIVVQQKTGEIRDRAKRAVNEVMEIGERLIEVKQILRHGQFGPWLDFEFGWDDRTARRYMAVAESFKSDTVSDLPIDVSALYALSSASVPEAARQEAVESASNGYHVTKAEANRIIAGHKSSPPKPVSSPHISRPVEMNDPHPDYENESQEDEEDEEDEAGDDQVEQPQPAQSRRFALDPEAGSIPSHQDGSDAGFWKRLTRTSDELLMITNSALDPIHAAWIDRAVSERTSKAQRRILIDIKDNLDRLINRLDKRELS